MLLKMGPSCCIVKIYVHPRCLDKHILVDIKDVLFEYGNVADTGCNVLID